MTVTELRKECEKLEAEGHGELLVGYEECFCNDSDYDMVDVTIDKLVVDKPFTTWPSLSDGLTKDKLFVRLS